MGEDGKVDVINTPEDAVEDKRQVIALDDVTENGKTKVDISDKKAGDELVFEVSEGGTYALVLRDKNGNVIDISKFEVYDENGKRVNLQTSDAYLKFLSVDVGKYYIKLPRSLSNCSLEIEKVNNDVESDLGKLQEAANKYAVDNELEEEIPEAEFYEIVMSWFIRKMGQVLSGLISILAGEKLSIDALVFDQYSRTTLTFFSNDLKYYDRENELLVGAQGPLNAIFSIFRKIAVLCYMITLVYMGIRVLFVATADKKAKYKEILFSWVKGVAILYLFPYVMRYAILLNHGFVTYLYDNTSGIFEGKNAVIESVQGGIGVASDVPISSSGNYMTDMYIQAEETQLLSYAICWFIMLIQVVQFLIVYMKRLITVMFMIAIFPLVVITYAIDKIGDGKSQAFDHWCKEFILQVFVQSFHAVNYVLIMGIVFQLPNDDGGWFLKIIGITYVAKGGDILRGLFAQMRGGAGKDGGPLSVAKSLIKTKAALGAIKGIRKVASNTFGANSLLGKGVGKLVDAHDTRLEKKANKTELNTYNKLKENGKLITLNADGTRKLPELTDDEVRDGLKNLRNGTMTDEELRSFIDRMNGISKERLGKLTKEAYLAGDITFKDRMDLEKTLTHAAALSIATGSTKGSSNYTIQQSTEVILKDRTNHATSNRNSTLDRYIEATKGRVSEAQLRTISARHSITVDEGRVRERRANEKLEPTTDRKIILGRALTAVRTASEGAYDYAELDEHVATIREAMKDDKLRSVAEEAMDKMSFSLDDFEANLHVQIINNSHRASAYDNADAQALLDKSIRYVKEANKNGEHKEILKGLNVAKIENLEEGYIPELINREKEEKSRLEKELRDKIAEIDNPYQIDRGPEYEEFLKNRDAELGRQLKEDIASGFTETIGGVASAAFKTGTGIATAGTTAGLSVDGKENLVNELLTVVPASFTMVDEVAGKVGGTLGRPINKVASSLKDENRVALNVNREAKRINEQYYENQAIQNAVNRELSDAEIKRQRLLDRLNKRIDDNNNQKGN